MLRPYTVTVGYNYDGQVFFDAIHNHPKVSSWFFSLTNKVPNGMSKEEAVKHLRTIDTYGLPANLLLKNGGDASDYEHLIEMAESADVNLYAVTVKSVSLAKSVKVIRPEMKICLADYYGNMSKNIEEMKGIIDVYCISDLYKFNDIKLMMRCHDNGIEVQRIANEDCPVNCSRNFGDFQSKRRNGDVEDCESECKAVFEDYPWLFLSSVKMYKQFLDYFPIDVIELETRTLPTEKVAELLDYWAVDSTDTKYWEWAELTAKTLPIFKKWIKARVSCYGFCSVCQKCKHFYEDLNNALEAPNC